jgi:ribosomal protein S13
MVFLLGKSLPSQQHVLYALAGQFEGVGRSTAAKMCALASIHRFCRVRDMNERHLGRLREVLLPHLEAVKRAQVEKAKSERMRPVPVPMPPVVIGKK